MWRAFFYATGFVLLLLGIESLVFERVQLASGGGMSDFATRMFERASLVSGSGSSQGVTKASSEAAANSAGRSARSAFGPSRFADGFGGNNTFSATPFRSNSSGGVSGQVPRVDLASYASPVPSRATASRRRASGKYVYARDWMPWSLLAVGSIVLLYTRSMTRGQ